MTANQLAQELKSKLASYVVSAPVTVSVVDIRSRQVFMTGQVGKPGGYPLIVPITVLQLIAQAGGLTTFANRKDIVILRNVGGSVQRLKFNYNNAVHGDPKQNISLQPGDTVIVPLGKMMKRSNHLRCVIAMFAGLCSGNIVSPEFRRSGNNNDADTSTMNVVASTADDSSTASRGGSSEPQ